MTQSIRGIISSDFPYDLDTLYKFIPTFLKMINPESDLSSELLKKPDLMFDLLNNIPSDVMNKFYESWSKKEKKGKKVKVRWLSKVIDDKVFNMMHSAAIKFELPAATSVYSYKKGMRTADCAKLFVGMQSIVALDIKDYYYAITGKMVEQLYNSWFVSLYGPIKPSYKYRVQCVSKMLSILFMAKDVRPQNIRFNDDTVLLQGTPHAGMIANAVLFDLDVALSRYCNENNIVYARYSDNFYMGSKEEIISQSFIDRAIEMVESFTIGDIANFKIKKEKVKVMPYYTHQRVLGIVVNKHLNISSYTEDIINAKISSYSKKFNTHYSEFIRSLDDTVMPLPRDRYTAIMVRMRKDLRDLKGLVSYLGSFNRSKYNKYHAYVSFLEKRAEAMYKLTPVTSSIYLYTRNTEETTIALQISRDSGEAIEGSSFYNMSRKHIIIDMQNVELFNKFVSKFDKGFIGIEYINHNTKLLIIPLDVSSKYLTLVDEIMISEIQEIPSSFNPVFGCYVAHNGSPFMRCRKDIELLGVGPDIRDTFSLSSIKIYNRDNPEGFVDFENYQMHLRRLMTTEANVCVVKNNLDSPDIMYSNLWVLRKGILNNQAVISVQ